ncbi:right-handed parallel beta-helix repeat-containing protein (plasmid) [Aliirhizobium terrae]|uniref:right-handed parallel beta-helix repeat-containing protein n=1 Tax=Terrirhizobium terrae TaxID=2926709 RepID=UPI0025776B21|nr:right-handed parallel beta-helix repeat-containing protein [Rhizobium sp. CC-CFT758]WJH37619.1 right-handed parallel beta-helix repeat-containing protein [Rhizobium sp. CC-CFT758]
MKAHLAPFLCMLLTTSAALSAQSASDQPDAEEIQHVQKAIREATCAEAPTVPSPIQLGGYTSSELFKSLVARHIYYVSPDGDDAWSGRLPDPNTAHTDGPFATIERARDTARTNGLSIIALAGGDYYLDRSIVFDARDTGLIVTARCNEAPILHGGPLVSGWAMENGTRWTAPLKLRSDQRVGDLFVNGIPQILARLPNAPLDRDPRKGWLFAARCQPEIDSWEGNTRFCFHAGDIPASTDINGLVAHIVGGFYPGTQWGSDTLPVTSVDEGGRIVDTRGTAYFFTAEGSRYFLAGSSSFLDAPGEWWHDAKSGRLNYIATDNQFSGSKVVAGVLSTFFLLEGADDMVISGLKFTDGAPQGSGKVWTDTRGFGAVRLEQADRVHLLGNIVEDVGVGIHASESKDVLIAGNLIGNIAGNGIYIGTEYGKFGKSDGAKILANHIHDIGRVYFETAGIWFQAADSVRIAGNLIENAAQFGIAGGSLWGPQDAVYDAIIEHNLVRNTNQQTADGGAIKMMGEQQAPLNSTIRYNIITGTGHLMNRQDGTFWPSGYENVDEWPSPISWAIYTDGKASGVLIEGNILSGNVSGIGINGGWGNVVIRNIIAHGSGAAFRVDDATGGEWHPSWANPNRIEENSVSIDREDGIAAFVYAPNHGSGYVHFARNRYLGNLNSQSFRVHPEIMPSGKFGSLADLQKGGMDEDSTVGAR